MAPTEYRAGTHQTAPPVPADAQLFKFPASLKWLYMGGAALSFGLALAMPLTESVHRWFGPVVVCATFLTAFGVLCLRSFNRCYDTVAVNPEGIRYLPRKGENTFIAWNNVASVSARDVMQRLVITDLSGRKTIRLEYQLDNFEQLRDIVLRYTEAARFRRPFAKVFDRNWANRGLFLGCFAACLLLAYLAVHQGQRGASLGMIGFAAFSLVALTREPASVGISNTAIVIKYLGWQRTISFAAVSNIVIADLHDDGGNVHATVIIERPNGKPIKLLGFREGSVALHDALYSAWRAARGDGKPAPVSTPSSEAAGSPQELLTTFHGKSLAALTPAILIGAALFTGFSRLHSAQPMSHAYRTAVALISLSGVALSVYLLRIIPRRLLIGSESLTVEYFQGRRVVPYAAITNISLGEFRNAKGLPVGVVKVERNGARMLRLAGFREDAPALYASLRQAWMRARGERA
jgi:hypothetical protein